MRGSRELEAVRAVVARRMVEPRRVVEMSECFVAEKSGEACLFKVAIVGQRL